MNDAEEKLSDDPEFLYGPGEQVSEPEESAPSPEPEQAQPAPEAEGEKSQDEAPKADDGEPTPEAKADDGEGEAPELNEGQESYLARQRFLRAKAENEAKAAREKAEELERKLAEKAEKAPPEVPPMPDDPFAENHHELLVAREQALLERAQYDREKADHEAELTRLEQERSQRQEEEHIRQLREYAESTNKKLETLKVSPDEFADNTSKLVEAIGVIPDIVKDAVSAEDVGPLMIQVLAENPHLAYEAGQLPPYQAATLLADVKAKALQLKPKPSNTPAPPEQLDGGGSTQSDAFKEYGGVDVY